jgi:3-oxoadipate enol-lactonase / 4-carboxymuconolactone decarboxylase
MTIPDLGAVDFGGPDAAPVILLGPSLGTSAATLWGGVARTLSRHARVIGWDLPGHGRSGPAEPFTVAELAAAVLTLADRHDVGTFHYAGDSAGGAVGLQLGLDAPQRIATATLLCTGAVIGSPQGWRDRAATVRADGIGPMVASAPDRWFAAGFAEREPGISAALLDSLLHTDPECYALTCEALAEFDLTQRLSEIGTPVLAVAGSDDVPTPPESLQHIAAGVVEGRFVVLDGIGHLAPAEAPNRVAELIADHAALSHTSGYDAGMTVRREVLGDAHVDRATAAITDLTADFQRFITEYAWGAIWTRPGLDRRSRSMITLTALIARGHHEEFAMHLRAARRNGLTDDEIKELIMQTAIYCGVPDANTAFRIASDVL